MKQRIILILLAILCASASLEAKKLYRLYPYSKKSWLDAGVGIEF